MNPDLTKLFTVTLAGIVAAPITVAAIKAAVFFGEFKRTVTDMRAFVSHATEKIDDHEKRLTQIEADQKAEEKYKRRHHSRRAGDPPPADDGDDLEEGA